MSDHIPDATKMISDTPRTDAAYFKPHATMYDLAGEMKLMERELNAVTKERDIESERATHYRDKWQSAEERIKRLEEDLMDAKNKHAALVADVAFYEDRGERIERLEKWIACLNPIAQHSGQSENREWHGVDIRWLYPSQVVYLGEVKP